MAIKSVVFDLDGVLWTGEKRMDGALDTVLALLMSGLFKIFYLTNNSGKKRQEVIQKLNRLGFGADTGNTYCSSYAMAIYLLENNLTSSYVVGAESLCNELASQGISVGYSNDVLSVAVGIDFNFSYEKISNVLQAIRNGAKLVVANADPCYPIGGGKFLPGCGAMVGAIVGATGHQPDFIVGKPNTYMLELLCKEHRLMPEEICVVGDMPKSDIQMAVNFGCESILFDPDDVHRSFLGIKVKKLSEIIPLLEERKRRVRI